MAIATKTPQGIWVMLDFPHFCLSWENSEEEDFYLLQNFGIWGLQTSAAREDKERKWRKKTGRLCDFLWSEVKVTQSCLTLCDPMDTVHGILQARILVLLPKPVREQYILNVNFKIRGISVFPQLTFSPKLFVNCLKLWSEGHGILPGWMNS